MSEHTETNAGQDGSKAIPMKSDSFRMLVARMTATDEFIRGEVLYSVSERLAADPVVAAQAVYIGMAHLDRAFGNAGVLAVRQDPADVTEQAEEFSTSSLLATKDMNKLSSELSNAEAGFADGFRAVFEQITTKNPDASFSLNKNMEHMKQALEKVAVARDYATFMQGNESHPDYGVKSGDVSFGQMASDLDTAHKLLSTAMLAAEAQYTDDTSKIDSRLGYLSQTDHVTMGDLYGIVASNRAGEKGAVHTNIQGVVEQLFDTFAHREEFDGTLSLNAANDLERYMLNTTKPFGENATATEFLVMPHEVRQRVEEPASTVRRVPRPGQQPGTFKAGC